jgi:hypothetical protein
MSRLAKILTPAVPTLFELETFKVVQLRQLCRDQGLKGYSRLRKQELIDLLAPVPKVVKDKPQPPVIADDKKTPRQPKGSTNETFGITCERLICELQGIPFPAEMVARTMETRLTTRLRENLSKVFGEYNIVACEYSGNVDKQVDFRLADGKTLSVKTNLRGDKICPQLIGQTTRERFDRCFGVNGDRKEWIMHHVEEMLPTYFDHAFCCDYLLWINEHTAECRIIPKPRRVEFRGIYFTRTLEAWNESNTVKMGKLTLGEFQVHRNRNCIKFRFNLLNLLNLLRL